MAKKYKDTDYLFLSARLRSLERHGLDRVHIERMLGAGTMTECIQVLAELGYAGFDASDERAMHESLRRRRAEAFADLSRYMPQAAILDVFRIKYDYHNLKVLVKNRGGDVADLLIDAGRFRADELAARYERTGRWDFLPPDMARAAQESRQVLAETGDAQRSDFVLDRAYFAELLSLARQSGCAYLIAYVRAQIDAANLRSVVRTQRMHRTGAFLQQVLFAGGSVTVAQILAGVSEGVASLYRATPLHRAGEIGEAVLRGEKELWELEKACDEAVLQTAAQSRSIPFGVEVAVGYLASLENELSTVRIILSGRIAGLGADDIRERLRDDHV